MENIDLKNLVKGAAYLVCMNAGGIAVYNFIILHQLIIMYISLKSIYQINMM